MSFDGKSEPIKSLMRSVIGAMGGDSSAFDTKDKCAKCGKPVNIETDFRGAISIQEFKQSLLCQDCQDEVFDNG